MTDRQVAQVVAKVEGLNLSFGNLEVLKGIDLSIHRGEILGLLGPSGAGKTTLIRAIIGLSTATRGKVTVLGHEMPSLEPAQRIGYMAQTDSLYELDAYGNLLFFGGLYGWRGQKARQRAREVLELVELTDHAHRPVYNYSGGMKRRLSLAMALFHHPQLLLLDEPTVGVDPVLRQQFWTEFRRLRDAGTAIVITTHAMDEADHCDRLALIRGGEIIASGSPTELKAAGRSETVEGAFLHFARFSGNPNQAGKEVQA